MYNREEIETFIYKINNEGLDYTITQYSDWNEFNNTPLGGRIQKARIALNELNELVNQLKNEYQIN
jgi:hypothetical protein